MTVENVNKDKLISDFKVVVADAEELLRATANQAGDKAAELRTKIQGRLADAKVRLADAEAVMVDKAKQAGRGPEEAQRKNWLATGLIYVNTEKPTLEETFNLVDTPLNRLTDADLRPAPEMIAKINALMF